MTPLRVVLADDQALIRAGFRAFLEAREIRVVAEAADGVEVLEAVKRAKPDVVLMDIRMPKLDGVEATRRLPGQRIPIRRNPRIAAVDRLLSATPYPSTPRRELAPSAACSMWVRGSGPGRRGSSSRTPAG